MLQSFRFLVVGFNLKGFPSHGTSLYKKEKLQESTTFTRFSEESMPIRLFLESGCKVVLCNHLQGLIKNWSYKSEKNIRAMVFNLFLPLAQ